MLEDYNTKRRFLRTPEPFGVLGQSDPDALRFVVQQHRAQRPHFDLRLEWGGVLRSWAVPEGPSLDPAQRRLAIATEPHPLAYLSFEGKIPEGEYGAGDLRLWDSGAWVPLGDPEADLAAGEMKFRLAGARLGGGWMLKKLPEEGAAWLLIKERDTSVVKGDRAEMLPAKRHRKAPPLGTPGPLPQRQSPQLPSPVDSPPEGADWLHEIKYDGYRTLAHKVGAETRFITRQGIDWTERYAPLLPAFAELDCESALLDGEVAVQDARGATSLELLQSALSEDRTHELLFYAFDLIHLDGRDLSAEPLEARKALLRRLIPADPTSRIQYSDHVEGDGRKLFAQVCRIGLEGVVSKRRSAPYRGERTTTWVKAKRFDLGLFHVIGWTTKSSTRHVASIILAEQQEELTYVGRAGTGLSLDETRAWYETFAALEIPKAALTVPKTPNAHFIDPGQFTAEISYRGRTTKNILRQSAILSIKSEAPPPTKTARLITDRDLAAIRLTNPDREMFEGSGTTKLDVALYYARAGEWMLPQLLDRPVTLIRCTTGKQKDCFYQRHGFQGLPDGVETIGDSREEEVLVIRNARGFLNLPQFGTIEFHPWDCTTKDLDHPDRMTIDLDPGEGVDWPTVVTAAGEVRERLSALGLPSFVKMTGGEGVHLVVPLATQDPWKKVNAFAKDLAKALAADRPQLFTNHISKSRRVGKLYVDVGRTSQGASAVSSYSLRADPAFPAALPLLWSEFTALTPPSEFHRKKALIRLQNMTSDPWADFDAARVPLPGRATRG